MSYTINPIMKTYKTYEDGLNEAWELAREVISSPNSENKSFTWVRENVIGSDVALFDIIRNYSASEIIEEIKKYEEEIKVGDEVVNKYGWKRVVTNTHMNGEVTLMDSNGDFYVYCKAEVSDLDLKKTGRHFPQIEDVLKQMQKD